MLSFAILSLALAILIWLSCYGLLMLGVAAVDYINGRLVAILTCAAGTTLIVWGFWFIAHRWPATR